MSKLCSLVELSQYFGGRLRDFMKLVIDYENENENEGKDITKQMKIIYNLCKNMIENMDKIITNERVIDTIILYISYELRSVSKYLFNENFRNKIINFEDYEYVHGKLHLQFSNHMMLVNEIHECLGFYGIYNKFKTKILNKHKKSKDIQEYFDRILLEFVNSIIEEEPKYKLYKLYRLLKSSWIHSIDIYDYEHLNIQLCFKYNLNEKDEIESGNEEDISDKLNTKIIDYSTKAFDILKRMNINIITIMMTLKRKLFPNGVIEIIIVKYLRNKNIMIDSVNNYIEYREVFKFVRKVLMP